MPQCISQQDQSAWLNTMTKCTHKRCTWYFGVICTHHQWLTELSCLSTEFSPEVIKQYLPYCGRSILAKAQLYRWILSTTGRTWLVEVGDAYGLQNLSPASLVSGYTTVDTTYKAPTCLTAAHTALWTDSFQQVVGYCGFTRATQRTGNAARPWEYSESERSMIALGFETIGYNLTGRSIGAGDYFDKECFCTSFTINPNHEPCSTSSQLDLTKERLWLDATCGPKSLPDNWTDKLKTTDFAYIPIEDWRWPTCVTDMPRDVIDLTDQCATDACDRDPSGYCQVKHTVDRACFCRNVNYDSGFGSCHVFEGRTDYVEWLHGLCGDVQDWHGLPDDWRELTEPSALEMIPWRWTVKPTDNARTTCASMEWKLGSFVLVNMATFLVVLLRQSQESRRIAHDSSLQSDPLSWIITGILIAAVQLLANGVNAYLVQKTPGYEDVLVVQLMLLWCSMPRLGWLMILPIGGVQQFKMINFSAAASSLIAEAILQGFSLYYMVLTVRYGLEHKLYLRNLENVEGGQSAKIMYAGALLWLIIISVASVQSMRALLRMNGLTESERVDSPGLRRPFIVKSTVTRETPLMRSEARMHKTYGTVPVEREDDRGSQQSFANLYAATTIVMLLLWVAQWLFWGGFIGLSSEE